MEMEHVTITTLKDPKDPSKDLNITDADPMTLLGATLENDIRRDQSEALTSAIRSLMTSEEGPALLAEWMGTILSTRDVTRLVGMTPPSTLQSKEMPKGRVLSTLPERESFRTCEADEMTPKTYSSNPTLKDLRSHLNIRRMVERTRFSLERQIMSDIVDMLDRCAPTGDLAQQGTVLCHPKHLHMVLSESSASPISSPIIPRDRLFIMPNGRNSGILRIIDASVTHVPDLSRVSIKVEIETLCGIVHDPSNGPRMMIPQ